MHSAWFRSTFLRVMKFLQVNQWGTKFLRGTDFAESLYYLVPPSVFEFWWTQFHHHSLIFNASRRFRSTFCRVLKFLQIKQGAPNFWGEPTFQKVNYLVPSFCISILEVLWTQIPSHSLDFSAFRMIEECFSQCLEIST